MSEIKLAGCPNPWCGNGGALSANSPSGWRIQCGCGVRTYACKTEAAARAMWNARSLLPTRAACGYPLLMHETSECPGGEK